MAGYNTIHGLRVKYLSADPANPEDGQVWYNSSTGNLRVDGIALASSWAAGGNLGTGRNGMGAAGVQTASITYGGQIAPGNASKNETETYNGTSWTEVNNLGTARYMGAPSMLGTQTATLYAGGARQAPDVNAYAFTEVYNGSSWSEVANLNTGRDKVAGAGTSTSALAVGGQSPPVVANVEEWNGSSWSEETDIPAANRSQVGAGSQTAALIVCGQNPTNGTTLEYDGSSWTAGGTISRSTKTTFVGIGGNQTDATIFGGNEPASPYPNLTESYDGSSWTAQATMATGRQRMAQGGGTGSAALGSGGYANGNAAFAGVEEFTGAGTQIKNLSTS